MAERFKERLIGGEPLLGTFVKTASPQLVEILASAGLDFIVIDQEHAPLGRESVDLLLLAARACGLPTLVRVAQLSEIGHALDCGAAGVIAPHIQSADEARGVVAACHYLRGGRGYSNSPRAGDYGRIGMGEHIRAQDAATIIVVMIEEEVAVAEADAILSVEGVDATLIGCADLTFSLGEPSTDSPLLREAVQRVARAAARAGRRALAPAPSIPGAAWLIDLGIDALVVGSDQGLLRAAAATARREFPVNVVRSAERAA